MAQFIAFDDHVEVNGRTILSVINAMDFGREMRFDMLREHGINPEPGKWYKQQKWLNAFNSIYHHVGEKTLFMIGRAIPNNAAFPNNIKDLRSALESIDEAYHMNHRGGEIGYYRLINFDAQKRKAIMECRNPYPSEFDRGIITTMLRIYKPKSYVLGECRLDKTKETRRNGGESCTYMINW
jgi:hypothetical protein